MSTPNYEGKEAALQILEETRQYVLGIARRAFAEALLKNGYATADDAHAYFEDGIPGDVDPVCLGAVSRPFNKAGCITKDGLVVSKRKENHAREITRWKLVDKELCTSILNTLPCLKVDAVEEPDVFVRQGELFEGGI